MAKNKILKTVSCDALLDGMEDLLRILYCPADDVQEGGTVVLTPIEYKLIEMVIDQLDEHIAGKSIQYTDGLDPPVLVKTKRKKK